MTLREWLKGRMTQEQFADALTKFGHPISQGRVSQIINGGTHALGTALAIEKFTAGDVTIADLQKRETEAA